MRRKFIAIKIKNKEHLEKLEGWLIKKSSFKVKQTYVELYKYKCIGVEITKPDYNDNYLKCFRLTKYV